MGKRILFVTPYPRGTAGSQRFRFELFYEVLQREGYGLDCRSFIDQPTWEILYKPGRTAWKILGTLAGFLRRFFLLFRLGRYDFVFVHREATPFGPPFFEWTAARLWRKPLIYDFDDAIWKLDASDANRMAARLKQPGKVRKICRWATVVSAGNDYLAGFARQYNSHVRVVPTVVDTDHGHNRLQDQGRPEVHIGWTGTHTTLKYLDPVWPVLRKLQPEFGFTFFVVCNQPPAREGDWIRFVPWSREQEIDDLLRFQIGLMPLADDEWANGKCGFKAIQYMSLGIPAVASAVGMNAQLIEDGVSGYLVRRDEDWEPALRALLTDRGLRVRMGLESRKKIEGRYSVNAVRGDFLGLFGHTS